MVQEGRQGDQGRHAHGIVADSRSGHFIGMDGHCMTHFGLKQRICMGYKKNVFPAVMPWKSSFNVKNVIHPNVLQIKLTEALTQEFNSVNLLKGRRRNLTDHDQVGQQRLFYFLCLGRVFRKGFDDLC